MSTCDIWLIFVTFDLLLLIIVIQFELRRSWAEADPFREPISIIGQGYAGINILKWEFKYWFWKLCFNEDSSDNEINGLNSEVTYRL